MATDIYRMSIRAYAILAGGLYLVLPDTSWRPRFGRINMAAAVPADPGIIAAYEPVHPSIPGAGLSSRHVVRAAERLAVDPNVVRGRGSWKPNCHVSTPRSTSFAYGALKSMREVTVPLRPETKPSLQDVDAIACVSGDNFPAAYWGFLASLPPSEARDRLPAIASGLTIPGPI